MKLKKLILSIMLVVSGCGLAKNGRGEGEKKQVIGSIDLLEVTNYLGQLGDDKNLVSNTGKQLFVIAAFKKNDLPESLRTISSESEIGTLRLNIKHIKYLSQYAGKVEPEIKQNIKVTYLKVYLVQPIDSEMIYLSVDKSGANPVETIEQNIAVQSDPFSYCGIMDHPYQDLGGGNNIPPQKISCETSGYCTRQIWIASAKAAYPDRVLNSDVMKNLGGKCYDVYVYRTNETKKNVDKPVQGIISMNEKYSSTVRTIKFKI